MSEVHSTAVIQEGAQIGEDCHIGPYCVVGANVTLDDGCCLHSHVVIDGHTTLGRENQIYPFASIGLQSQDLKWKGGNTHTRVGGHNTIREYVTIHSATDEGDATVLLPLLKGRRSLVDLGFGGHAALTFARVHGRSTSTVAQTAAMSMS